VCNAPRRCLLYVHAAGVGQAVAAIDVVHLSPAAWHGLVVWCLSLVKFVFCYLKYSASNKLPSYVKAKLCSVVVPVVVALMLTPHPNVALLLVVG